MRDYCFGSRCYLLIADVARNLILTCVLVKAFITCGARTSRFYKTHQAHSLLFSTSQKQAMLNLTSTDPESYKNFSLYSSDTAQKTSIPSSNISLIIIGVNKVNIHKPSIPLLLLQTMHRISKTSASYSTR